MLIIRIYFIYIKYILEFSKLNNININSYIKNNIKINNFIIFNNIKAILNIYYIIYKLNKFKGLYKYLRLFFY